MENPASPDVGATSRDHDGRLGPTILCLGRVFERRLMRALAQAGLGVTPAQARVVMKLHFQGPLSQQELVYEVERLVIDLEERALDERSEFTQNALAEAEQSGDAETARHLLLESQAMNDQRRSLHRRREQTRLLVRPAERVAGPNGDPAPSAPATSGRA